MLIPGVYYIVAEEINRQMVYSLRYHIARYDIPKIIYGDVTSNMVRVWNEYVISGKSTGVMLTGASGNAKTLSGQILSNLAIDNEIPVIMVTEIKFTIELISYLGRLSNCVIFLDEFRKNVDRHLEQKTLTMFSDLNNTKKLFILTENDKSLISEFIINRPGRFRYHYDFTKVSQAVFEDYISRFNLTDKFRNELTQRFKSAPVFSFDHLQTLVSEHLHYPDDNLESLLSVLNISLLRKKKMFKLVKVVNKENPKQHLDFVMDTYNKLDEESVKLEGRAIYLNSAKEKKEISTYFGLFQIADESQGLYKATSKCGGYEIELKLDYADSIIPTDNNSGLPF